MVPIARLLLALIVAPQKGKVAGCHARGRSGAASFRGFRGRVRPSVVIMMPEEIRVLLNEHGVVATLLKHNVAIGSSLR